MKRMLKMELVVFGQYLKQLMFTMAFMGICVAVGMGTIAGVPSIAFIMMMFGLSMSGAAYDEQNSWGTYRMTMPLSRREVVLGRYAFNLCAALCAAAAASVVVAALVALGSVFPISGFAADLLAWNEETMVSAVAGMVSCGCIGLALSSISIPVYFKLGQTRATQWLPFIMMLLSVLPFVAIAVVGGEPLAILERAMGTVESAGGFGAIGAVALGVALGSYCLSAFVSIKLYEARHL